jgi:hypothetical protein
MLSGHRAFELELVDLVRAGVFDRQL